MEPIAHPIDRYDDVDAAGRPNPLYPLGYCSMRGHSERGCSTFDEHVHLIRQGHGVSTVPGPSERELAEETDADVELRRDEHLVGPARIGWARDLDGWSESDLRIADGNR